MSLRMHVTLEPMGPATAIELTDDQVAELGGGKRAAVRVTVGPRTARLRLGVMGGKNLVGLSKAARAELEVEIGDTIDAEIALDAADREVEVPAELAAALEREGVRAAFDALTYTRRKEAARGVAEAKRDDTRERRITAIVDQLRS